MPNRVLLLWLGSSSETQASPLALYIFLASFCLSTATPSGIPSKEIHPFILLKTTKVARKTCQVFFLWHVYLQLSSFTIANCLSVCVCITLFLTIPSVNFVYVKSPALSAVMNELKKLFNLQRFIVAFIAPCFCICFILAGCQVATLYLRTASLWYQWLIYMCVVLHRADHFSVPAPHYKPVCSH